MAKLLDRIYLWALLALCIAAIGRRPAYVRGPGLAPLLLVWRIQVLIASLIMGAFSAALGDDLANYVGRATAPTALTTPIKMSLHTGSPAATGALEVTGGSYGRNSGANPLYSVSSGAVSVLAAAVSFTAMPAVTVTHIGLWDNNGTPKFLQGAALAASQAVGSGNTLQITAASNTWTGA